MNVSELHTTVALYNERDGADFTHLAHVPLRPSNDYYTLSDILMNGMSLDGAHVNLLAGIKSVSCMVACMCTHNWAMIILLVFKLLYMCICMYSVQCVLVFSCNTFVN